MIILNMALLFSAPEIETNNKNLESIGLIPIAYIAMQTLSTPTIIGGALFLSYLNYNASEESKELMHSGFNTVKSGGKFFGLGTQLFVKKTIAGMKSFYNKYF